MMKVCEESSAEEVWCALKTLLAPELREKIIQWNPNLDGLTLRLLSSHSSELSVALGLAYTELDALEILTMSLKLKYLLDTTDDESQSSKRRRLPSERNCNRMSIEKSEDTEVKEENRGKRQLFPSALMSMLSDRRSRGIIDFDVEKRALVISDRAQFEKIVMPRYFGLCSLKSFMRQLSYYNFNCTNDRCDGLPLTYIHRSFDLHSIQDIARISRAVQPRRRHNTKKRRLFS